MRKVCLFALGFAVTLVLSNVSFAADVPSVVTDPAPTDAGVVVDGEVAVHAETLPAGYPPCCGVPVPPRHCVKQRYFRPAFVPAHSPYNTPYSYCPQSGLTGYPAYPVGAAGIVPPATASYPAYPVGAAGTVSPATAGYPGGPGSVVYRPTPIRSFVSLFLAPRPYIGYDPYAGAPYAY